jgi:hypothetical protein
MLATADTARTAGTSRLGGPPRSLLASALLVIATAAACTDDATSRELAVTSSPAAAEVAGEVAVLDDDEIAGLLWMREEEQLAHDVYTTLGDRWGLRIFDNIAASERSHIDSVTTLLERYDIEDRASGNEPGTFTEPAIQELHDELVADGMVSLEAALAVGARIEELDIADLRSRAAATDVADIDAVYADLERASRNHLRAFMSQLEMRSVSYEPTELDQAFFDAIVSGATERGRDA